MHALMFPVDRPFLFPSLALQPCSPSFAVIRYEPPGPPICVDSRTLDKAASVSSCAAAQFSSGAKAATNIRLLAMQADEAARMRFEVGCDSIEIKH